MLYNTKNDPIFLDNISEYKNQALWFSFKCTKCGKSEIKRNVSLKNSPYLICGPCLRKIKKLEKYGDENYNNSEKSKQTCLEKYGVTNALNLHSKKPITKETIEKRKQTCLEKYGVDNPAKAKEIKDKIKKTNNERYGGNAPACSKEVVKKMVKTAHKKYNQTGYPGLIAQHNHFLNIRIQQLAKHNLQFKNPEDFKGRARNDKAIYYDFICTKCGNEFRDSFTNAFPICRKCHPQKFLKQETELIDYVKSIYNGTIIEHDRSLISPKELDIYLPELKIAIEYNGTFWHSFNKTTKISFAEFCRQIEFKRKECEKLGIRLITIDECDWLDRPEVFKRFLQDALLPRKRIFARKCELKEIDTATAKTFCEYYHVNGYRGGSIKYGLYYKEELLVVAVFGGKVKMPIISSKGTTITYIQECIRLCYKTGYDVIGGWAKIQKHYGKPFLHYVNLKYFRGENKTGCGYRFIIGKPRKVLYRNALQKKTGLFKYISNYDPNLSDFWNCINNDAFCIVDVGNDIRYYNLTNLICKH